MPVMVLDVPAPAWNEVSLQCTLFGLDLCPEYRNSKGNTVVEITGTWEKLNEVLTRIKRKGPEIPELLGVMGSKTIDQCR